MKKEEIIKMTHEEHRAYHRRIIYILVILMIVLFAGATFYHYIEKWNYLDSVYFSAATITTVGYGDIAPKTDIGKLFTIFYLFMGVGIAVYGLSLMATHFVEVREEFWLQQFGRMKLGQRTETIWDKLKKLFIYDSGKMSDEVKTKRK